MTPSLTSFVQHWCDTLHRMSVCTGNPHIGKSDFVPSQKPRWMWAVFLDQSLTGGVLETDRLLGQPAVRTDACVLHPAGVFFVIRQNQ